MSDFVITDEQVGQALENAISLPMMHDLMEVVLARPLSEHDPIRLNTQPEGCYCWDCKRYGQKECPYPGSNATMSLCNSFYMDVPIRLNTQPEGCYCWDCQRYEQKECPYPGSNATTPLCNSFYMDVKKHDAAVAKKERERVLDELLSYCRGAMESKGMLFEMQQVPIDDIEYAYAKLIKGESLRRSEP